mgnify:CR=1 FL=1
MHRESTEQVEVGRMLVLVALAGEEEAKRREEGQEEHRGRVQRKALHRCVEHEEGAHRSGSDELGCDETEHLRPIGVLWRSQVMGDPVEGEPAHLAEEAELNLGFARRYGAAHEEIIVSRTHGE